MQLALKFHTTPDVIENMPAYWYNRMMIWMQGEADGERLTRVDK